jgi:hypothetical protein
MADFPPFMNAYGNVAKILDKIKEAQTPERFSQDFLATVLGVSGGGAKPFIPLAKRLGLLSSDGAPTELYRQFRNPSQSQQAMARALKNGYPQLYSRNEFAHALDKKALQGLVMEATGLDKNSKTLTAIVNTFEALKSFANFEMGEPESGTPPEDDERPAPPDTIPQQVPLKLPKDASLGPKFSYNIYLNLPETTDPAVFNAIFKSLKDNLL